MRKESVMKKRSTKKAESKTAIVEGTAYVGLDVHKESISVAALLPGNSEPVQWKQRNSATAGRSLARKLKRLGAREVLCCYEAGPCGYGLQRQLQQLEVVCQVIAPSLIPLKAGARVKTDRRDARKLAELLRAGLLTEVRPPTPEQEAVRAVCRCRDDARGNLNRERQRLVKFLLCRDLRWQPGRSHWTQAHRGWLRSLRLEFAADQRTFDDYMYGVEYAEARLAELERAIEVEAQREPYRELVKALCCFRGIKTVTAMTILAELHDITRFPSPRQLMSYLGLTPSEHSSSDRVHRGPITKAGNRHVRRILVEAAWHYRHRPQVGKALKARRQGQPGWVVAHADTAMRRLHKRYLSLVHDSMKAPTRAVAALARELAGFIWATLMKLQARRQDRADEMVVTP
jgi:transposase